MNPHTVNEYRIYREQVQTEAVSEYRVYREQVQAFGEMYREQVQE